MQNAQIIKAGNNLFIQDPTEAQTARIIAALPEPAPAPLETGDRIEVANIFRVHPGSLKRWEKAGKLHPIKITARTIRYDMREIRAILGGGAK